jgi:hypothetical protein
MTFQQKIFPTDVQTAGATQPHLRTQRRWNVGKLSNRILRIKKKFKKYFLQKSKTHLPIHLRRGIGQKGLLSMTSSEAHDPFQIANRWLKEREQGSLYLDTSRLETAQTKKKNGKKMQTTFD